MSRNVTKIALYLMIVVAMLSMAACGGAKTTDTAADKPAADGALQVGIVLPTKDEPRWIQDEGRFQELLKTAEVPVEILFSQGDSAKEKANVESLITKGVKVIILTPQDGAAAAGAAENRGGGESEREGEKRESERERE